MPALFRPIIHNRILSKPFGLMFFPLRSPIAAIKTIETSFCMPYQIMVYSTS